MRCRNAVLLLVLSLVTGWSPLARAAPDEGAGDAASPNHLSPGPADNTASGEADWDWEDLDLGGEKAAETPGAKTQSHGSRTPMPAAQSTAPPPETRPAATATIADERDTTEIPPSAAHEVIAPEPPMASVESDQASAGPAGRSPPAAGAAGADDWGWDWEGIEDQAAEPVTDTARRARREKRMAELSKKPRPASTAQPDFGAVYQQGHAMFPGGVPFQVIPSKKDVDMHPCLDCHGWAKSDLTPRVLKQPHDNFQLKHGLNGKGEFWCFTCHDLEGDGGLRTLEGLKLSFDEAYIVCSQCHSQETRDWYFGDHGKRVENWRGTRQLLNCTACHYEHRPALEPRKPKPGPTMRMGMERPKHWVPKRENAHRPARRERIWEQYAKQGEDQPHE